jgi:SAM-dependent methyltransferase
VHTRIFEAFNRLCAVHGAGGIVLEIGATGDRDTLLCLPALATSQRRFGLNIQAQKSAHGFEIITGNANDMAMLPTASVDTVLCNSVLEHDARFWLTLAEIHRVLRPGGLFVVGVPGYSEHRRASPFTRLMAKILPVNSRAGLALQARAATTPTLLVHRYPRDYYRFGADAIRHVFLADMEMLAIEEVMIPPRFVGVARRP